MRLGGEVSRRRGMRMAVETVGLGVTGEIAVELAPTPLEEIGTAALL